MKSLYKLSNVYNTKLINNIITNFNEEEQKLYITSLRNNKLLNYHYWSFESNIKVKYSLNNKLYLNTIFFNNYQKLKFINNIILFLDV